MNRRGEEPITFLIFLFLMVLVGGGIWLGVNTFYGKGYDFRLAEASILRDKWAECFLNNDVFSNDFELEDCDIDSKVIAEDHMVYAASKENEVSFGVKDYINQCYFEGARDNEYYPRCAEIDLVKNGVEYRIVAGSAQKTERGL